jgi:hypothetical protein
VLFYGFGNILQTVPADEVPHGWGNHMIWQLTDCSIPIARNESQSRTCVPSD